ncbi:MAG: metallophosphoesterase [Burkholderiaceae bacterium]
MQVNNTKRPGSDEPVFRFAVVADTHVNETEEGGSSPFITNASANARARYVFNEISQMSPAPDFVVHLGDIVHPVPSLPGFNDAVAHFRDMTASLKMPLHVIPGNHDVGDKHIDWMPADLICADYLRLYRDAFGPDYYGFDHEGCRFLMLNSVLFNSGLSQDHEQRAWFSAQLGSAGALRVFVFMHYPPYIHTADEAGNYDNIDQPARAWVVEQLQRAEVEAVFAGHVHNFWYDRIGNAEMYMLPSTAFMRHDFSEFYRIAPSIEHARGDAERYGYFLVDVFADDHVAYSVRTMDGRSAPGETATRRNQLTLAHPKTSGLNRVGVELRHPWAETMQISATGGVQEFGRKWARNDYPLQSLWEMGVRLCKVPSVDLAEDYSAQRMSVLATSGNRFVVTCLGKPREALLQRDLAACGIEAFEVNATADSFESMQAALATIRKESGVKLLFAKILSGDNSRFDGKHFTHFVKSGFSVSELDAAERTLRTPLSGGVIDGVTVRIDFDDNLPSAMARIHRFADEMDCDVLASLKLAGPSVAQMRADDAALAARTAEAVILSQGHDRVSLIFDTFMDVDRGYYPRQAFIDRRFNPRLAAGTFAFLNTRLSELGKVVMIEQPVNQSTDATVLSSGSSRLVFTAGGRGFSLHTGPAQEINALLNAHGHHLAWDLINCLEASARQLAEKPIPTTNNTLNPAGIKSVVLCDS